MHEQSVQKISSVIRIITFKIHSFWQILVTYIFFFFGLSPTWDDLNLRFVRLYYYFTFWNTVVKKVNFVLLSYFLAQPIISCRMIKILSVLKTVLVFVAYLDEFHHCSTMEILCKQIVTKESTLINKLRNKLRNVVQRNNLHWLELQQRNTWKVNKNSKIVI